VLANLYRDGNDSMGWHADDEPELGDEPVIASVSLGAERDFTLRRRDRRGQTVAMPLPHGSLLLMAGPTQRHWQHALPKRRRMREPRINLTFRCCAPSAVRAEAS
jgi:alkylated DNA repair dioxygenase AlkB